MPLVARVIDVGTDEVVAQGVGEAFAATERRLYVVSWRTTLTGGAYGVIETARDLCASLGLASLDLITLALEGPLRDPGVLGDLRQAEIARWFGVSGPNNVLDEAILRADFDGMALKLDPDGGWNERNRIKAAFNRGMGVIALDFDVEVVPTEEPASRGGLLSLFKRRRPPPPTSQFRVDVAGWTEQQVAIALTLTDPSISSLVVQPNCIPSLESLAWCVEQDLPAGAQAQIEMARFSGGAEEPVRRRG
jgi:hypothetical protein